MNMDNRETVRISLDRICQKTMAQHYAVPPLQGQFFEWVEGKGMVSTPLYLAASREHQYIDMQYPVFDWQQGVGFYALIEAGRVLQSGKPEEFVREWLEGHLDQPGSRTINTTAPFLSVLELRQRGGQRYLDLCEQRARFCMAEAARADEGAFEHTVIGLDQGFRSQIWADTLFMASLFLARWGKASGNGMYLEEAVRQLKLHYAYLSDPKTGLMFHAYNCADRSHLSAVRWGRANVWGIHACFRIHEQLPEGHPAAPEIRGLVLRHLEALVKVQEADRALRYLLGKVAPDGEVLGCSGGTPVMASPAEYDRIPMVMSYYGQGLAMLTLIETLAE